MRHPESITVLYSLALIKFRSPQITAHTNPVQITIQGLCNSYSLKAMAQQLPKWSHQHYHKASFPVWRKDLRCTARRHKCEPKTLQCGNPDKTFTRLLRQLSVTDREKYCDRLDIREKLCQNRQHRTSNSH